MKLLAPLPVRQPVLPRVGGVLRRRGLPGELRPGRSRGIVRHGGQVREAALLAGFALVGVPLAAGVSCLWGVAFFWAVWVATK